MTTEQSKQLQEIYDKIMVPVPVKNFKKYFVGEANINNTITTFPIVSLCTENNIDISTITLDSFNVSEPYTCTFTSITVQGAATGASVTITPSYDSSNGIYSIKSSSNGYGGVFIQI